MPTLIIRNFCRVQYDDDEPPATAKRWPFRKLLRQRSHSFRRLPWQARGLADELLVADGLDDYGRLEVGADPAASVAQAVGARLIGGPGWRSFRAAFAALLADGYVLVLDDDHQGDPAPSGTPTAPSAESPWAPNGAQDPPPWAPNGAQAVPKDPPTVGNHSSANLVNKKEKKENTRAREARTSEKKKEKKAKDLLLEQYRAVAVHLWAVQERYRAQLGRQPLKQTDERLLRIAKLVDGGATFEDAECVLRVYFEDGRRSRKNAEWFNGETNWRPDNFDRALGRAARVTPRAPPRPDGTPAPMTAEDLWLQHVHEKAVRDGLVRDDDLQPKLPEVA